MILYKLYSPKPIFYRLQMSYTKKKKIKNEIKTQIVLNINNQLYDQLQPNLHSLTKKSY